VSLCTSADTKYLGGCIFPNDIVSALWDKIRGTPCTSRHPVPEIMRSSRGRYFRDIQKRDILLTKMTLTVRTKFSTCVLLFQLNLGKIPALEIFVNIHFVSGILNAGRCPVTE
jgi:hypothetical protein